MLGRLSEEGSHPQVFPQTHLPLPCCLLCMLCAGLVSRTATSYTVKHPGNKQLHGQQHSQHCSTPHTPCSATSPSMPRSLPLSSVSSCTDLHSFSFPASFSSSLDGMHNLVSHTNLMPASPPVSRPQSRGSSSSLTASTISQAGSGWDHPGPLSNESCTEKQPQQQHQQWRRPRALYYQHQRQPHLGQKQRQQQQFQRRKQYPCSTDACIESTTPSTAPVAPRPSQASTLPFALPYEPSGAAVPHPSAL